MTLGHNVEGGSARRDKEVVCEVEGGLDPCQATLEVS